jgi:hypothetical protein
MACTVLHTSKAAPSATKTTSPTKWTAPMEEFIVSDDSDVTDYGSDDDDDFDVEVFSDNSGIDPCP